MEQQGLKQWTTELTGEIRFRYLSVNSKHETNTNPDPNRYRRRCPDPNARIQKNWDCGNIEVYIINSGELTDKHLGFLKEILFLG